MKDRLSNTIKMKPILLLLLLLLLAIINVAYSSLLYLFSHHQYYYDADDETSSSSSSNNNIIVVVNAFIVTTTSKTSVHGNKFRKGYRCNDITAGVKSSSTSSASSASSASSSSVSANNDDNDNDNDRWGDTVDEDFNGKVYKPSSSSSSSSLSSLLPLPENTKDKNIKIRSHAAMIGTNPKALNGRCNVNFNYNNNNDNSSSNSNSNSSSSSSSNTSNNSAVQWLHVDPPVLVIDDFLTNIECNNILQLTKQQLPSDAGRVIRIESRTTTSTSSTNENNGGSNNGGSNSNSSNSNTKSNNSNNTNNTNNKRISTTWYVRYGCSCLAPILDGISKLLPKINLNQIEEIQLVQYAGNKQGFAWHEDALLLDEELDEELDIEEDEDDIVDDGIAETTIAEIEKQKQKQKEQEQEKKQTRRGGQRIATVLIYLDNECQKGSGRTLFRDLIGNNNNNNNSDDDDDDDDDENKNSNRLAVSPKIGRALLFFPAITGGQQSSILNDDDDGDINRGGGSGGGGDGGSDGDKKQIQQSNTSTNKSFGTVHSFDNTRADHRTIHAGEPPIGGGNKINNENNKNKIDIDIDIDDEVVLLSGQKHIAQLWIHSKCHTPVVFGRGLNKHEDANKNIDNLRACKS